MDYTEIKKSQEEMSKIIHDVQEVYTGIQEENKSNKDTLQNLETKTAEIAGKFDEIVSEVESEKKAREELELALSKIQTGGGQNGEQKGTPEYKKAFQNFLRKKNAEISQDVELEEIKALIKSESDLELSDEDLMSVKTLLVGSNPDGGYLVPVERSSVIKKRVFETTPIRQLASVYTTSTEAMEFVLDDEEFESEKTGELDTRNNTATGQIGIITIPVKEQYAQPIATQKILDDAALNIEQLIANKVSDKFSRTENAETINGSGANEMQGICVVPSWATLAVYERGALETRAATGAGASITADDLIDLQSDLLEAYQANAYWMLHRKIWAEITKLQDANGQYLINPQMLFAGVSPQLLGRPVRMSGDMVDDYSEDGTITALYGDFREGYALVDRIGIRVVRDPYTTKGVVKFYTTKRTGGGIVNFQAIKRIATSIET